MRALCVALLLCAGCPKKQTTPTPEAPAGQPAPQPTEKGQVKPAAAPAAPKPGDPCSGGEVK